MPTTERVTVTLPAELIEDIDRLEKNRSRFIVQAVEHELARRRHEELRRSLEHPHPEASELADVGLDEWVASLPEGDEGLVDMSAGTPGRARRLGREAVNFDRGTVVLVGLDPTVSHEQRVLVGVARGHG